MFSNSLPGGFVDFKGIFLLRKLCAFVCVCERVRFMEVILVSFAGLIIMVGKWLPAAK